MIKQLLIIILLAGFTTSSCKDNSKQTNKESSKSEKATLPREEIIRKEFINSDGDTLKINFNITEDEAVVVFNGETIKLKGQKPASGIWYKNNNYELRGKGEYIELKKDEQTVFKN